VNSTVYFGHFGICSPWMTVRDIEQIAYDWPRSWAGWIRKSSSPLVVLESKDSIDGNKGHEKINCRDVRKCHGPTSLLTKEKVGEYQKIMALWYD